MVRRKILEDLDSGDEDASIASNSDDEYDIPSEEVPDATRKLHRERYAAAANRPPRGSAQFRALYSKEPDYQSFQSDSEEEQEEETAGGIQLLGSYEIIEPTDRHCDLSSDDFAAALAKTKSMETRALGKNLRAFLTSDTVLNWAKPGRSLRHIIENAAEQDAEDKWRHQIDAVLVEGLPFVSICTAKEVYGSTQFTVQHWGRTYAFHHTNSTIGNVRGRTMLYAVTEDRVFHFVLFRDRETKGPVKKFDYELAERSGTSTCIATYLAKELFLFFLELFSNEKSLSGLGIDQTWYLGCSKARTLPIAKLRAFQDAFMRPWSKWAGAKPKKSFWHEVVPVFHSYEYGRNISLPVTSGRELVASFGTGLSHYLDEEGVWKLTVAIASNLNVTIEGEAQGLLISRKEIETEYQGSTARGLDFYPLGFHPGFGNMQASTAPDFFANGCLEPMNESIERKYEPKSDEHYNPIVCSGDFQMYSEIKTLLRHTPQDLSIKSCFYTGAFCFDTSDVPEALKTKHSKTFAAVDKDTPRRSQSDTASRGSPPRPLTREMELVAEAMKMNVTGTRFEATLTIDMQQMRDRRPPESNNGASFADVGRLTVAKVVKYWEANMTEWEHVVVAFPQKTFPGILIPWAQYLQALLDEQQTEYKQLNKDGGCLPPGRAEFVAIIERLATYCFTGDQRVISKTLWSAFGLDWRLEKYGFPGFSEDSPLSVDTFDCDIRSWPTTPEGDLLLGHLRAIEFQFTDEQARRRRTQCRLLMNDQLSTPNQMKSALQYIVQKEYIPSMKAFVEKCAQKQCKKLDKEEYGILTDERFQESSLARTRALKAFKKSLNPFSTRVYPELLLVINPLPKTSEGHERVPLAQPPRIYFRDYAAILYELAVSDAGKPPGLNRYVPKGAGWLKSLRWTIERSSRRLFDEGFAYQDWIRQLAEALEDTQTAWLPGACGGRLSGIYTMAIRSQAEAPINSGSHSFQRRAPLGETSATVHTLALQFPLVRLPQIFTAGYKQLSCIYGEDGSRPDQKLREYYGRCWEHISLADSRFKYGILLAYLVSRCTPLPRITKDKCSDAGSSTTAPTFEPHPKDINNKQTKLTKASWCALFLIKIAEILFEQSALKGDEKLKKRKETAASNAYITTGLLIEFGLMRTKSGQRGTSLNPQIRYIEFVDNEILQQRITTLERLLEAKNLSGAAVFVFPKAKDWQGRVVQGVQDEEDEYAATDTLAILQNEEAIIKTSIEEQKAQTLSKNKKKKKVAWKKLNEERTAVEHRMAVLGNGRKELEGTAGCAPEISIENETISSGNRGAALEPGPVSDSHLPSISVKLYHDGKTLQIPPNIEWNEFTALIGSKDLSYKPIEGSETELSERQPLATSEHLEFMKQQYSDGVILYTTEAT